MAYYEALWAKLDRLCMGMMGSKPSRILVSRNTAVFPWLEVTWCLVCLDKPVAGNCWHFYVGFFNFDICLNWKEASETSRSGTTGSKPPCAPKPQLPESDTNKELKAEGYAPGDCKVLVNQWVTNMSIIKPANWLDKGGPKAVPTASTSFRPR